MYTVYLAGQISSNKETYNWRERIRMHYKNNPYVQVIDPCVSEFNLQAIQNTDSKLGYSESSRMDPGVALLPFKDRNYVNISNVIFFNLNLYTPDKPMIGTMFEMAWAFDDSSKMVVGIFRGDRSKNWFTRHPFITQTVQTWVDDEMAACALLDKFSDVDQDDMVGISSPLTSLM